MVQNIPISCIDLVRIYPENFLIHALMDAWSVVLRRVVEVKAFKPLVRMEDIRDHFRCYCHEQIFYAAIHAFLRLEVNVILDYTLD